MTKATYYNDDTWHYLHVKDHATGSPQVCAGVSAIVYALAGWLANFGDQEQDTVLLDSGEAFFSVDSGLEGTKAAFDLAIIGLLQIAKTHPDHLRVEEEKVF